jgi:DNA-binding transcriptional regulator/RsmH inhibitor MraZ
MFIYGKWELTIDEKWRLNIPTAIGWINNFILVKENKDGCIEIKEFKKSLNNSQIKANSSSVFRIKVETKKNKHKRILIPLQLRKSNSFYYGKRVILVSKGDYLEIWPRSSGQ